MFNKGKIEDLSSEILNLNTKINELSKFGAMNAVQVQKEIADLGATKTNLEQEVIVNTLLI